MGNLEDAVNNLNKHFGESTIISGNEVASLKIARVSTGSLSLDIESGGGVPYGRVTELFGYESTGKTFMAIKTAVQAQKQGKKVVWIDVEGTFDATWATLLGLDVSKIYLARPEKGEVACDILDAVIRSGDCGLVILDSTAALIPEKDIDTSMEDAEQLGNRARMVNRLVRKLTSALNMKVGEELLPNDCAVIFINQIRQKIGISWGSPDTTPGGFGLKAAASIRIHFRKSWVKDPANQDNIIGQSVTFVIEKNKTFPPYRRGEFVFYTDGANKGQIDTVKEVLVYGLLSGIIERPTKLSYVVDSKKLVGEEAVLTYLKDNPKVVDDLKDNILKFYSGNKNG
jgi:recombination protein RecA